MDLDYARKQLLDRPTDVDTITNVVLDLLGVVGQLDHDLAVERQARQDLERSLHDQSLAAKLE